jgi:predicted aspartyl protease
MGKVMQIIKLTNSIDEADAKRGYMTPDAVRTAVIEAVVDTGATMLGLPADVVEMLGLPVAGYRKVRYGNGSLIDVPWVGNIKITILGREAIVSALVQPVGMVPLIGQIPLEELDLLVDPKSRELRVNPLSPDTPLMDSISIAVV